MSFYYKLRHFSIKKLLRHFVIKSYEEQIAAQNERINKLEQAIKTRDAYIKGLFDSLYLSHKDEVK